MTSIERRHIPDDHQPAGWLFDEACRELARLRGELRRALSDPHRHGEVYRIRNELRIAKSIVDRGPLTREEVFGV